MTDSQKGAPLSNQSALELLIAELDHLDEQVELWDMDMDAICEYVEAGEFVSRLLNITSEHFDSLMSEIEVVGGGPGRLADFIAKISKLNQSIWDRCFDGGESLTDQQLLTEVDSDRIFFKYAQSRKRGEMVLDRSEQSQSQALRFAATEYRQIASLDSDWHLQRERAWRLQLQVSGIVLRLFENGKLVGMPDVESAILKTKINHERNGNKNTVGLWKTFIWIQIAGYFDEERAVTIEEYEEYDGLRLEVKWVSLCPGAFGKRYPDIFKPLSVEDSKEGLDREVLWQEFHFEIMNYYAKSCELLADYVEKKVAPQNEQSVARVVVLADSLLSFTNAELMSELAKVIKTNKEKHWKANELRLKILECNPGRTTSVKSIEKNLIYQKLLENQGRKRKRKIDPDVLHDVVSRSLREHAAENGAKINGRRVQSRD